MKLYEITFSLDELTHNRADIPLLFSWSSGCKELLRVHVGVCVHMCTYAHLYHSSSCGENVWIVRTGELGRGITGGRELFLGLECGDSHSYFTFPENHCETLQPSHWVHGAVDANILFFLLFFFLNFKT